MYALQQLEATEANLVKLERLWNEISAMIPAGISFGENGEYEDGVRAYDHLIRALPSIDGWRPTAMPPDLDGLAQSRFEAMEIDEFSAHAAVESWVLEPGRQLREYRFRLVNTRKAIIREALVGLIDQIDADIRKVRSGVEPDAEANLQIDRSEWDQMREHLKQIGVLLGSSVEKPERWSDMVRHMRFGQVSDLIDIETIDWPNIKAALRKGLYGANEPVPVAVADLLELVAARPTGPIMTALAWSNIGDDTFERLLFTLISDTPGYENPEWLMQTRAADRGRDLSVSRVSQDDLAGTFRQRVVIQCKHWLSRSVALSDCATAKDQMALWSHPRVDVLVIATSGRFTADAVSWIEQHNSNGASPRIEMWPESHLELVLAARPAVIAEFGLRGHSAD